MEFNLETAISVTNSPEDYPISYEKACLWADISPMVGQRVLVFEFKEGFDYIQTKVQNGKPGRPTNSWKLSLDCFICFVALTVKDPSKSYAIRYLLKEALRTSKSKPSPLPVVEDKLPLTSQNSVVSKDPVDLNQYSLLDLEIKAFSSYVHNKFYFYDSSLLKLNKELSSMLEELRNQNSALIKNIANSNKDNNNKN